MTTKVCLEFDTDSDTPPEPVNRSYTTSVGDGTSLTYNVMHGLGTRSPLYVVRDAASGVLDGYDVTVTSVDDNSVRLDFATAPAAGAVSVTLFKA